jgi:hypothetical protein
LPERKGAARYRASVDATGEIPYPADVDTPD